MTQESKKKGALCLRAQGDWAILEIETAQGWVELIRERLDSPFSHIIEPAGIDAIVNALPTKVENFKITGFPKFH